ncbi:MAG: ATP-dependent nuclease [Gaiella sp.]
MIKSLRVDHFKGFERFSVPLSGDAFLVGPNNAGKSSLISALRFGAHMLRHAGQRSPDLEIKEGQEKLIAYSFSPNQFDMIEENLRYEFRPIDTRLVIGFANRAILTAVWPAEDDGIVSGGYFCLREEPDGWQPASPQDVRRIFPPVGVIPVLSPFEHEERILTESHVRRNFDSRLSSRHFRNQMALLRTESSPTHWSRYDEFVEFAEPWLPELRLESLVTRPAEGAVFLDLYYLEGGSRIPKEVVWVGDGMQVWLQLLLQVFRLRASPTIILDEPDVYLHADLQRRLVDLLESLPAQTITATHSAEVLTAASPESVIWIDRHRKRAVTAPSPGLLEEFSHRIGTSFNLRLAKALRTKALVFVEGLDMKVLRALARTLGAERVAKEEGVVVIALGGYSNWDRVEPFQWLHDKFLRRSTAVFVILDRDYRTDDAVAEVIARLGDVGVSATVWRRKELESYLLEPSVIARLTDTTVSTIAEMLGNAVDGMRSSVFARLLEERQREASGSGRSRVSITEEADREFETRWSDETSRIHLCPAKDVLASLNTVLQAAGHKSVSFRSLASEMSVEEIDRDVAQTIRRIEQAVT